MTLEQNNRNHARRVAKLLAASKSDSNSVLGGIWHWVDGVAHGISHFFTNAIPTALRIIYLHLKNLVDAIGEVYKALARVVFWVQILIWHVVQGWLARQKAQILGDIAAARRYLVGLIFLTTQTVLTLAMRAVRAERDERIRDIRRAESEAKALVRSLHGTIEREAASGYTTDRDARAALIVRLLDFAAERNPELRAITSDIAKGLLDLLTIDDPVLRILIGFLINKVIDRLGIDKALGALIRDLLAPLLGQTEPRNLHAVTVDVCQRLDGIEGQWAQFMEDGGSQVEQAGIEWRNITSVAGNLAIVAFTVQAVVDPDGWAAEISDTIGAAVNDLADAAGALFRG